MVLNVTILLFSELSFTVSVSQKAYCIVTFLRSKRLYTIRASLETPKNYCLLADFPMCFYKTSVEQAHAGEKSFMLYWSSTVDFCIH